MPDTPPPLGNRPSRTPPPASLPPQGTALRTPPPPSKGPSWRPKPRGPPPWCKPEDLFAREVGYPQGLWYTFDLYGEKQPVKWCGTHEWCARLCRKTVSPVQCYPRCRGLMQEGPYCQRPQHVQSGPFLEKVGRIAVPCGSKSKGKTARMSIAKRCPHSSIPQHKVICREEW